MKTYSRYNIIKSIVFSSIFIVAFTSCKKDSLNQIKVNAIVEGLEQAKCKKVNVYVAGQKFNGQNYTATYWKNGTAVQLSDGLKYAQANAIFVVNNNVYAAGIDGGVAVYWKNGTAIKLPATSTYSQANSLFVLGNDVYVAGNDGPVGVYWKNGVEVKLNSGNDFLGQFTPFSIFISKKELYIAGIEADGTSNALLYASYWKNNAHTRLNESIFNAKANGIFVVGADVYVSGIINNGSTTDAVYWKNGTAIKLNDTKRNAYATSLFVTNTNDVYVAGFDAFTAYDAVYWKNGTETKLANAATNLDNSYANAIYVLNNTVYVAGNKNGAVYWENGKEIKLTDETTPSYANAIFVTK